MSEAVRFKLHLFLIIAFVAIAPACAFAVEFFGVTIPGTASKSEAIIAQGKLAYDVSLDVGDGGDDLKSAISGTSALMTQSGEGAADIYALLARARADQDRITAALYSEARYGASIEVAVAGVPLEKADPEKLATTPGATVAVSIVVVPGPVFTFGNVSFASLPVADGAQPLTLSEADYGLVPGAPAKSTIIVDASERLVEAWRSAGFPLAHIVKKDISADHATSTVSVEITVDQGEPAVYGWVNVVGADKLSARTIAAQSKLTPGEKFNPADFKKARARLAKLESIESVRIVEGKHIDGSGGIPISLEVTERKPHYIGATASVSTIDGAELQAFWGHRNLFGHAERLRIDGTISQIGSEGLDQLQFDAGAVFTKSGILDIDTDLVSEFRLKRDNPDTYDSFITTGRVGLTHRFSPYVSGSTSVKASFEDVDDAFGTNRFTTISLPSELTFDSRDNRLDATHGLFALAYLSPTAALSGGASFVTAEAQAATYHAFDKDGRVVFAARAFAGTAIGAALADVPASSRYFAGGGGSVRGYQNRSLGPVIGGEVVGGLSLVRASAELRIRLSDKFGIVPFVDAASVSETSFPKFSDVPFIGAGIGLRYFTAIGPIRLDFATPLTERDGQPAFAFYIGLGQAF